MNKELNNNNNYNDSETLCSNIAKQGSEVNNNVLQCNNENKNKDDIIWYNSKDETILTHVNNDEECLELFQEMNETTENKNNKEEVVKDIKHINTKDKEVKYKEKIKAKVEVKEVSTTEEI